MTALELYAAQEKLTMYRIAKISNLPASTIKSAFKKTLAQTSIRTLQAIAKAASVDPGELLNTLIAIENELTQNQLNDNTDKIKQQLIDLGFTIQD